jgi:hypothetical protein
MPLLLPQQNFDYETTHDVIQLAVLLRAVRMGIVTANAGLADGAIHLGSVRYLVMPSCLDALRGGSLRSNSWAPVLSELAEDDRVRFRPYPNCKG